MVLTRDHGLNEAPLKRRRSSCSKPQCRTAYQRARGRALCICAWARRASLRDAEACRAHNVQRAHAPSSKLARKKSGAGRSASGITWGRSLAPLLDDRCLTFREWCQLNSIGERTGRRILASGNGPVVTQLTTKRIGITVGNNRRWQEARARA